MAEGKWIRGLSGGMPLAEAASLVLPARFKPVLSVLPLAVESAGRDVEHVHQLRVATRRAAAALKLFSSCLPSKKFRTLQKRLRRLRRAAGLARDWDVFFELVRDVGVLRTGKVNPSFDFLLGIVAARRMDAQFQLIEVAAVEGPKWQSESQSLLDKESNWVDPEWPATVGELAVHRVSAFIFEMTNALDSPPDTYEELHRFRILGKRLRYSMEVFAECFADPFRERLYPAVEEMQELLGKITDAHVAANHIIELREYMKAFRSHDWSRYKKPIDLLLQAQRRVFPRERKRFATWCSRWKQLAGELTPAALLIEGEK